MSKEQHITGIVGGKIIPLKTLIHRQPQGIITKEKPFGDLPEEAPKMVTHNVVQVGLSKEQTQKLFEARFGVDTATRTGKQWCALVQTYTIEVVMKTENMTHEEVIAKCDVKTFKERIKKMTKGK